jgi:hypothetical protein
MRSADACEQVAREAAQLFLLSSPHDARKIETSRPRDEPGPGTEPVPTRPHAQPGSALSQGSEKASQADEPARDSTGAWMERARLNAQLARTEFERPLLPRLIGLALAIALVAMVFFAFHAFLSAMQRLTDVVGREPAPAIAEPQPVPGDAMPVYVVPDEPANDDR